MAKKPGLYANINKRKEAARRKAKAISARNERKD